MKKTLELPRTGFEPVTTGLLVTTGLIVQSHVHVHVHCMYVHVHVDFYV